RAVILAGSRIARSGARGNWRDRWGCSPPCDVCGRAETGATSDGIKRRGAAEVIAGTRLRRVSRGACPIDCDGDAMVDAMAG
ncbi:MAG TPA: hypothetical protein VK595_02830, partial [Vicinamibacterales bacterium]|nr:hypothetical protein [Vicinamibacterales bacterium]